MLESDILYLVLQTAVAFLTKRVTKPQRDDYNKLIRTVQYIRDTQNLGIAFDVHEPTPVVAYIDASPYIPI